jgi:ribonuclease Z
MSLAFRALVLLMAALFAGTGLRFWIAPESAAQSFGLGAMSASGLVSLRADLGGLFVGLALITAAGAWRKHRSALLAAVAVLAAIITGRAIGWLAGGGVALGASEFVIELIALMALLVTARLLRAPAPEALGASHRRAKLVATVGISIAAVGIAALMVPSVQQAIFDSAAQQMSAKTNAAPLADGALRVAVCGSSAPLPSASRAKACVAVFAAGKFWIVDTGPESVENLVLWGIPLSQVGGVLLTHFHSDHIGDLGELQLQTWAGGRPAPLAVYGGPGIEGVVAGFNQAYRLDQGYRTAHHGEHVMPSASWGMVAHTVELVGEPTSRKDRSAVVLDEGGLRITAIEVDHPPIEPAYAYRFDYLGRSVVISGDLKYHPPLIRAAQGADLLVSEAISRSMTHSLESAAQSVARERTAAIMHDVQDYHISPEEAASLANDAGVRLLAFYHLLPAPDGFLPRQLFARGVNKVRRGGWTIADDGSLYTMPAGSTQVVIDRIDN